MQQSNALGASTCNLLALCRGGSPGAVFPHVPSTGRSSLLSFLPDCSVAGTQTVQEWVQQQREENYPDGYEHFLRLCLTIIYQMAKVRPCARWHDRSICDVANTGRETRQCPMCTAVLQTLQSNQGEQACTGSSTSKMIVLQCVQGEQAGSICRVALLPNCAVWSR